MSGCSLVRWSEDRAVEHGLVCIPWAGAGAAPFRPWAAWLSPEIDVWAARLPGRESRMLESPLESVEDVVDELAEAVTVLDGLPFALFGHCSGALIGFELVRELRRRGARAPTALLIASCRSPALKTEPAPPRAGDLREDLRRLGLTSEGILANDQLFELLRPALEADVRVGDTYVYRAGEPLELPITVFRGSADEHIREADLSAWERETTGPFRTVTLAGDHLFSGESWRGLAVGVGEAVRVAAAPA